MEKESICQITVTEYSLANTNSDIMRHLLSLKLNLEDWGDRFTANNIFKADLSTFIRQEEVKMNKLFRNHGTNNN